MIYITQLIFLEEGKEAIFHEFEDFAIPLIEKYQGKVLYRIRPTRESFMSHEGEMPYEVHVVSFENEEGFQRFMQDETRKTFLHLKDESVKSMILIKGEKL